MAQLALRDLVANRTMSAAMAATLALGAKERRSLLMVAIPRLAGKTTTLLAALEHAPPGTELHELSADAGPTLGIPEQPDDGYLLIQEIAETAFPHYLWGEPVRQVFRALRNGGFSLATAMHAGSINEALRIIVGPNEVPADDVALIDVGVYIQTLGPDWRHPERRVVSELREILDAEDGAIQTRLLQRWNEHADQFEAIAVPERVCLDREKLERLTVEFARFEP